MINSISGSYAAEQKIKLESNIKGLGAFAGVLGLQSVLGLASSTVINKIGELDKDKYETVIKAAVEGLNKTGLADKNTKILLCPKSIETTPKNLIKSLLNPRLGTLMQVDMGLNACYVPAVNTICMPQGKMPMQIFHEMGHALNNNFSKFGKNLQKSRGMCNILAGVVLGTALSMKENVNEKNDDGTKKKGLKHFYVNNADKIAALCTAPVFIEELSASLNAEKITKDLKQLTPDMLKKMRFGNAVGLLTYGLVTLAMFFGAKAALNIKKNVTEKRTKELEQSHINS